MSCRALSTCTTTQEEAEKARLKADQAANDEIQGYRRKAKAEKGQDDKGRSDKDGGKDDDEMEKLLK